MDDATMTKIIAFLNARADEDERVAQAAMSDTLGIWAVGDDPHSEYVEVLGALRPDARPGDGYWHAVCSWDVAVVAWDGHGDHEGVAESLGTLARHIARHDPARALAEVDSKRRIIAEHPILTGWGVCTRCSDFAAERGALIRQVPGPCNTLRLLAVPYSRHPEYLPEWAPDE